MPDDAVKVARELRCDAPGCPEEMIMRRCGQQFCYVHALAKGNEERAAEGLPPVVVDEEGDAHVCH